MVLVRVWTLVAMKGLTNYYPAGALSGDCATSLSLVLPGTSL